MSADFIHIIVLFVFAQSYAKEILPRHAAIAKNSLVLRQKQLNAPKGSLDSTTLGKPEAPLRTFTQGSMPGRLQGRPSQLSQRRSPEVAAGRNWGVHHSIKMQYRKLKRRTLQKLKGAGNLLSPVLSLAQLPMQTFSTSSSEQIQQQEMLELGDGAAIDVWTRSAIAWRHVAERTAQLVVSDAEWIPEWKGNGAQARATSEAARAMVLWWEAKLPEMSNRESSEVYADNVEGVLAAYTAAAVAWEAAANLTAEISKDQTLMPVVAVARATEVAARATADAAAAESKGVYSAWKAAATAWGTAAELIERRAIEKFRADAETKWESAGESIGAEAVEDFRAAAEAAWYKEELRMELQEREAVEEARAEAETMWQKDYERRSEAKKGGSPA
eukprot:gnl/MRDRNA2_/MRDRNA2_115709_c0_seq1.p1 gnl/MRDRNA2_/MRDRNA2_115709_c0~~gnl/MRDRNA2_/MRDRNA2_115709_c0_seq1.p1  ORF type:complete len:388 (-),score=88.63 gnl/MRDRNA2_/MRDRNA2_115709_c0_seq1:385-1548(-)